MTILAPENAAARPRGHRPLGRGLAACVIAAGALSAASCKDGAPPGPAASTSAASPSAAPSTADVASASPGEAPEAHGDDIRPVYPIDHLPPLPLAQRYCEAVQVTPLKRRSECCPNAGSFAPTSECIRTLSSALRSGAVTLTESDVDACAAAVAKETAGCDWVISTSSPTVAACLGIVKGTLKDGAVCRSNLECDEGLRCRTLGATRPGRCAPPLSRGMCNIAVDSLATFARQDDFDRHHPECVGFCRQRQCLDPIAAGAACKSTFECGAKGHCIAGKCSDGPLPEPGQPCTDACAGSARCWKGKCLAPKAGGESCVEDAECRAHCDHGDGGKAGTCGADCPIMLVPPPKKR